MATTPQGRVYPDADKRTPNKKEKKRLDARIRSWETLSVSDRGAENGYTKPGSYRK